MGFVLVCYFHPLSTYTKEIALHSLEATIFHQDLIHRLFCRFQQGFREVKGPIASFLAAFDQTGILNAHSLP